METETGSIYCGSGRIPYRIMRNTRSRRIRIAVYPNGDVIVRCPPGIHRKTVDEFILDNAEWVMKSVGRMRSEPARLILLEDGAVIPLFGRDYKVEMDRNAGAGRLEGNSIRFNPSLLRAGDGRPVLFEFYRRQLENYLTGRLTDFEGETGLSARSYAIREYRSKWGSCSPEGKISFNLKLAAFPSRIVDYVIVHELCHLKYRNHSARFWKLVTKYMPDASEARTDLRREARYNEFA